MIWQHLDSWEQPIQDNDGSMSLEYQSLNSCTKYSTIYYNNELGTPRIVNASKLGPMFAYNFYTNSNALFLVHIIEWFH